MLKWLTVSVEVKVAVFMWIPQNIPKKLKFKAHYFNNVNH